MYDIYKKYQYNDMIFVSQKDFLLSRDLTGLSFLFLILFPVTALISKFAFNIAFKMLLLYLGYLLIQFILLSITGRNRGNRFALNVLAEASSDS